MFKNIPKISYSLLASYNLGLSMDLAVEKISSIGIDLIHYDVSEEEKTLSLEELDSLRTKTDLPFDVHLCVSDPHKYISMAKMCKGDYFCVHIENDLSLKELEQLKKKLNCNFGVAINMDTPIEHLYQVTSVIDYALFMSAKAGVSGGKFDDNVLEKIKHFKDKYPLIKIHVDGGINDNTAVFVRDIGVDTLISGSYILQDQDYSKQVSKLVGQNLNLPVTSIMHEGKKYPWVLEDCTIQEVANEIDKKHIGCTCVLNRKKQFVGIITDADIRRYLISCPNLTNKKATDIVNRNAFTVKPEKNIIRLLRELEKNGFLFSVIPVVTAANQCLGIVRLQDILFRNVLGQRIKYL